MLAKIVHFFKYNNAFTLAIMFVFLSTGTIFAANEDLREVVISSEERLIAVDNSYIRTLDLERYDPLVEVIGVTENEESFFVAYRINNVEVVDGVWIEVSNEAELVVAKDMLGDQDLGLYVAEELREVAQAHLTYLKEVQEIEREIGQTDRSTLTEYGGLVGRVLDSETASFAGYTPVIPPKKEPIFQPRPDPDPQIIVTIPKPPVAQQVDEVLDEQESDETDDTDEETEEDTGDNSNDPPEEPETTATSTATTTPPTATTSVDTTAPTIELVGESEAQLVLGETYAEPGATALDDVDGDLTAVIVIEGTVDTSATGTYDVVYRVSDAAGNEAEVTRVIEVVSPPDTTPPVITLNDGDLSLALGETYAEPGATALDDVDGDLTAAIVISGTVDTAATGTYSVTYEVSDAAGNQVSSDRTVTVQ